MARAGDAQGTRGGRASAELRSGTHKHARGEIPLHPALREHQGAPVPGARVTLVVPPPRCGTGEARLRSCCAIGHTKPCQQLCPPACAQAWLWSDAAGAAVVPPCDCAHPHMGLWSLTGVAVLVPLRGSHTRMSTSIHVCSRSHTHTEPWLYTRVAVLTHTRGHVPTRAWLFSYS